MRLTSPVRSGCRRSAPHATATPSSLARNTVVSGCAICSAVMWKQNSGGVSTSSVAFSSPISRRTSSCSGVSAATVIAMQLMIAQQRERIKHDFDRAAVAATLDRLADQVHLHGHDRRRCVCVFPAWTNLPRKDCCRYTTGPQFSSIFRAAMKASWGISTSPNWRIFFLPFFCFSSSLRFRVMSPP